MIWGCEVTSRQGHFLGLFMKRPVKFLSHVEGAIDAIKEQGGLCIIPHPMGRLVPSLSLKKIEELLSRGYPIDGIELYNPSPANASVSSRVRSPESGVGPGGYRKQRRALLAAYRRRLHAFPGRDGRRICARPSSVRSLETAAKKAGRRDCRLLPTSGSASGAWCLIHPGNSAVWRLATCPRRPTRPRPPSACADGETPPTKESKEIESDGCR